MRDGDDDAVHGKPSSFYLLVLFLIQRLKHRRSGPGWAVAKTGGRPGGGKERETVIAIVSGARLDV